MYSVNICNHSKHLLFFVFTLNEGINATIPSWYVTSSKGSYNRITYVCRLHIRHERDFTLKTKHIVTKEFLNLQIISNLIYTSQNYKQSKLKNCIISSSLLIPYVEELKDKQLFKNLHSFKQEFRYLQLCCNLTLKCSQN